METLITLMGIYAPILMDAQGLADGIRNFVAPLVLLACSLAALKFLFQREFMQMGIFIVISIVVLAIFFAPQFLESVGRTFGSSNADLTWN